MKRFAGMTPCFSGTIADARDDCQTIVAGMSTRGAREKSVPDSIESIPTAQERKRVISVETSSGVFDIFHNLFVWAAATDTPGSGETGVGLMPGLAKPPVLH